MSFGTNLQYLRKQNNLTQEQFAEKMEVSRQTVSKWESDNSYPETEKIVVICDMFDCSMDMLLRGDCTKFKTENINEYNSHYNFFTFCIAFATAFVLIGVAVLLFLNASGVKENVSVAVFLSMIAVSVAIFIISGIKHSEFQKSHTEIIGSFDDKKVKRFKNVFPFMIAGATVLVLIGVIWMALFSNDIDANERLGEIYTAFFMIDIAVAVSIFITAGMLCAKYNMDEYKEKDLTTEEKEYKKKNDKYSGIIMLLATVIFFVLGFVFDLWKISWVAFPVGGIMCAIASIALKK